MKNKLKVSALVIALAAFQVFLGTSFAVTTVGLVPSGAAPVAPAIPSPGFNVAYFFEFPSELEFVLSVTIFDDNSGFLPGSPGIFEGFDLDAVKGFDNEGNAVYGGFVDGYDLGDPGSLSNPLFDTEYGLVGGVPSLLGTGLTLPTTDGLFGLTDYVLGAPDATAGFFSTGKPVPQNFLTLGNGGAIHIAFDTKLYANPFGPDLVVYEVGGGEIINATSVFGSDVVPEPATILLLLSGISAIGIRRRLMS